MSSNNNQALLIFGKAPVPGNAKTRLRSLLTEDQCLSLHVSLLQDTILLARQVESTAILYLSEPCKLPFPTDLEIRTQTGTDLGERMFRAFENEMTRFKDVVIIGTDSPLMPAEQIRKAFEYLKSSDLILGPTEDGGYYLIGLNKLIPEIFLNIPWGTGDVLKRTLDSVQGKRVDLLEPFWDVDVTEDLFRLQRELTRNLGMNLPHTRKWMKDWEASYFKHKL